MAILCFDLGGTGSRAALFDAAGQEIARAEAGAGAVSLGVEVTLAAVEELSATLLRGRKGPDHPGGSDLVLGLAGIGLRDRVEAVRAALGGARSVRIIGDGYGALIDATGGRPGTLIAVGTGVAAMRLLPDGRCRTASGWGFPAGDLGGGAWIGLQTVAALTRTLDGATGPGTLSPDLAQAVMAVTGRTAPAIMTWQTGGRARDFARLVPLVLRHAEAGEAFAEAVLRAAADEIARVAESLWDGADGEVHLTGGLASALVPVLREGWPHRGWALTAADPLRGLCRVAMGLAPEERLIARPGLEEADYGL